MTIQVGDRIPSATLSYLKDGVQQISTDELFGGKTVVLFSVPGAFTPTCSARHLPGYVDQLDALKAKGVPVAYVPFAGEQHGFRRAENVKRALDAELYFYGRIFGFPLADPVEPVAIENLSQ